MATTAPNGFAAMFTAVTVLTTADRAAVARDVQEDRRREWVASFHRVEAAYHMAMVRASECTMAWLANDPDRDIAESRQEAAALVMIAHIRRHVATPARAKHIASEKVRDLNRWAKACSGCHRAVAAWRSMEPAWRAMIQAEAASFPHRGRGRA